MVAVLNHVSVVGLAAAPAVAVVATSTTPVTAPCNHVAGSSAVCAGAPTDGVVLSLPNGAKQCPGSGPMAACITNDAASKATPGSASTPDGQTACSASPDVITFTSPAACSDSALPAPATTPDPSTQSPIPSVVPSVPQSTLQPAAAILRLELSTDSPSPSPGDKIVLKATASTTVSGTGTEIEIFDKTTGTLAGACAQQSQCLVAYAATSGVHTFQAFITAPTSHVPTDNSTVAASNTLTAKWLSVTLVANTSAVGPDKPITITATSTVPLENTGYELQLFDVDSNARLTYCTHGASCSTSMTQSTSGRRNVIATLARPSTTFPAPDAQAQSQLLPLTWLSVTLDGRTSGGVGSPVYLSASANADLASTPWSLGIFDQEGHLVGQPCKAATCDALVSLPSGATPHYTAEIGAVPPVSAGGILGHVLQKIAGPDVLVDIQAKSAAIQPSRLLWGVDSCKSFTDDPNGATGLYPQIAGSLGTPDFWGRYLTDTVCPGISWAEISAAYQKHMGILPIYNDYPCSNVSGYGTGQSYAASAVDAAHFLHIPAGTGLAIDIEPPGPACPGAANVDVGFLEGWYDGIIAANYTPVYYGNGTSGSEFASAWCVAGTQYPQILGSFVWSFEPSLLGNYNRATAPAYAPNQTGCGGFAGAWQYQIGSDSSTPDVDGDEAVTSLPLWYPTPWK